MIYLCLQAFHYIPETFQLWVDQATILHVEFLQLYHCYRAIERIGRGDMSWVYPTATTITQQKRGGGMGRNLGPKFSYCTLDTLLFMRSL